MKNPKWHRDEIILALDLYFDQSRGPIDSGNKKIIELSKLLNSLPIFERYLDRTTFRNPNGVSLKLSNFLALDPGYVGKGMKAYSKLDKEVFEEFSSDKIRLHKIAEDIKSIVHNVKLTSKILKIENDEVSELDSVKEGQVLYKLHKVRERDVRIVEAKKKKILSEKGVLECEVCSFNFEKFYGSYGRGFIECHHLLPLSNFGGKKETKLSDLALVCSNCHSIIHKSSSMSSIEEFKLKINLV